ncbi:MAG TPA: electron transfer flavoprotein subunit alpha [Candidatus Omnitrophota bacterium]|nr:electron transfer flavoprotein subunit alpha [Candidatus Omnitrophota bacterium]HPT07613.1 electron transfer flavoprotein subunit alpha [Candidatus Omnitrophota bacterium]
MAIQVIVEKCTGCTMCVKVCPFDAIRIMDKKAVVDYNKCTLCGACKDACKFKAILVEENNTVCALPNIQDYKGIWVFIEQKNGKVQSVSYELLGKARELAQKLTTDVSAVVIGNQMQDQLDEIIFRGADKIYLVEAPEIANFQDDPYSAILTKLVQKHKPEILLCGATNIGRSLISRVAINIKAGLTADCTGLDIDLEKKILLQTRPAFGGNIMATIISPNYRPQMATVRHKVFQPMTPNKARKGKIIKETFEASVYASRTKLLDIVDEIESLVNLSEADIIVSGGRGMQAKDNFKVLEEFAHVIGAAVGSSRAAVDSGWMPYSHQVGQTGRTVAPKVYFACGISGQIQHIVGMSSSKIIIAINKDPEAPIFKYATYGIVGDVLTIIPALTKLFKEKQGK